MAGKAAGMQVVAVPSMPSKDAFLLYSSADLILPSLLIFQCEVWGLPPINDSNSSDSRTDLNYADSSHGIKSLMVESSITRYF